jgi:FkbH-like protein
LTRVVGRRPIVDNRGYIELGRKARLLCEFAPVELRTAPHGRLIIGCRTGINYGTTFEAVESVSVGANVDIGPHCIITDADTGSADRPHDAQTRPVVIEDGVWLASRVTVLPGSRIGAGSIITAGSVVDGEIPAGVVAGGVPARVIRTIGSEASAVDASADVPPSTTSLADVVVCPHEPFVDNRPTAHGVLIADFTIDQLVDSLCRQDGAFRLEADVAPFGTVVPTLMMPAPENTDFAVVWTRVDEMLPSFGRVMAFEEVQRADLLADVDRFTDLLATGLGSVGCVIVPTWSLPPWQRGRGITDARPGGTSWALSLVNQRLIESLGDSSNVFVIDVQRWLGANAAEAYSDRLWYLGKIPFSDGVFDAAANDIAAAIGSVRGHSRKLLVVDLDNTLWGGVVGDDGWESLRLGGHDAAGEAFVDFQRVLKQLKARGVLLALVSKNDEAIALEAIDRHDAMVLTRDDFVAWRINWSDKAANIADLVAALNLGLQSVVFIDDNPHERARVSEAFPEVLVPDWPEDPTRYVRALLSLTCFDSPSLTDEDLARTEMYGAERRREELLNQIGSLSDWIRDLGVVVRAEPLTTANLTRAAQLLNKTNQMNLTTRRLAETELHAWSREEGRDVWCVSVSDRLGDAGLTGLIGLATEPEGVRLVDYVMSCRVMGRRVEEAMLHLAVQFARWMSTGTLAAALLPTAKNGPCQAVLASSQLEQSHDNEYIWDLANEYPAPSDIKIEIMDGDRQSV